MKHLLLEIEVSDYGQENDEIVGFLIEDALYSHMHSCNGGGDERKLFMHDVPRVRVLTEESPL